MVINQFAQYDFYQYLQICSTAEYNCLGGPKFYFFTHISTHISIRCDNSCISGCATWGTCNQCKNKACKTCESFNSNCTEDPEFSPCFQIINSLKTINYVVITNALLAMDRQLGCVQSVLLVLF